MPIRIDRSLLVELGLAHLPAAQQDRLLRRYYDVLEKRVGMRMGLLLSARDLEQFEYLIPDDVSTGDRSRAADWLSEHVPGYGAIVQAEHEYMQEYLRNAVAEGAISSLEGENSDGEEIKQ